MVRFLRASQYPLVIFGPEMNPRACKELMFVQRVEYFHVRQTDENFATRDLTGYWIYRKKVIKDLFGAFFDQLQSRKLKLEFFPTLSVPVPGTPVFLIQSFDNVNRVVVKENNPHL